VKLLKTGNFSHDVAIHPNNTGRTIIIYPGAAGDIDGYNAKYFKLAQHISTNGLAAVLRSGNPVPRDWGWELNLRAMIDFAQNPVNSEEICGNRHGQIFLMGFSAGAGAIAAVAHRYIGIDRILIIAPAFDAGFKEIEEGLSKFQAQLYILIGENDEVVGCDSGLRFYSFAKNAAFRQLMEIPNCDHQFRGTANGRILSQAPFWAFGEYKRGKTLFDCPSTVLY